MAKSSVARPLIFWVEIDQQGGPCGVALLQKATLSDPGLKNLAMEPDVRVEPGEIELGGLVEAIPAKNLPEGLRFQHHGVEVRLLKIHMDFEKCILKKEAVGGIRLGWWLHVHQGWRTGQDPWEELQHCGHFREGWGISP